MTLERLQDGSVRLAQLNEWQLRALRSIPAVAVAGDHDDALRRLFPAPFAAGEATSEQQEDWAELVQPELEALFDTSLRIVAADLAGIAPDTAGALARARAEKRRRRAATRAEAAKESAADSRPEPPPADETADTPAPPRPRRSRARREGADATTDAAPPAGETEAAAPASATTPATGESQAIPPTHWTLTVPSAHVEDWFRAMNQARLMLAEKHHAHRTDSAHIARMFMSGHMETLIQYELLTGLCGWWVDVMMQTGRTEDGAE